MIKSSTKAFGLNVISSRDQLELYCYQNNKIVSYLLNTLIFKILFEFQQTLSIEAGWGL